MAARSPRGVPAGPPTDAERSETRRAIRLVALCCAAVVAVYLGLTWAALGDDAWLVQIGRHKDISFVLRDVRDLDRQAVAGERPITWIVGSSITREAFDAAHIQRELRKAGSDHVVVKFAFNRGAPVFSLAVLDDLPVQPGDRVVTSISEDNFQRGWLVEAADFTRWVQTSLTCDEILALPDVPLATRLDWCLASTPPTSFFRNRDDARHGLVRIGNWAVGAGDWPEPKAHVSYWPFTDSAHTLTKRERRTTRWDVDPDTVQLEPGVTNWDALERLLDAAQRRTGQPAVVVHVPAHPEYYERFAPDAFVERIQRGLVAKVPGYTVLRPRQATAYLDFKHPNSRGRPGVSDELADVLIRAEGLAPPRRPTPRWLAAEGDVPAVLLELSGERP